MDPDNILVYGGLLINLLVVVGGILKFGTWSGRVTVLLEQHQKGLDDHDTRIVDLGREVSHMQGAADADS